MSFSSFVYYNALVCISKTTKDTTLAQENFFLIVKLYDFGPRELFSNREIPFQMALFLSRSDGVHFRTGTLSGI